MVTDRWKHLLDQEIAGAVRLRRELHGIPELGGSEHRTSAAIRAALSVAAEPIADTGLLVQVGTADTPAVAIRAELDALPLVEQTGADFSATEEAMHACGHDIHMAALVALVRAAAQIPHELPAPLMAVFQPSEEREPSGALAVVADPRVVGKAGAFIAVHVHPALPWGSLGMEPDAVNAAADEVRITIRGDGGHAAYPHQSRSPVPALLDLGQSLQGLAGRIIDPVHPAVVSIGVLRAGETANIIPAEAELHATVRSMTSEDQNSLLREIRRLTERICDAYGCTATLAIAKSEPPLVNDAKLVERARSLAPAYGVGVAPPWRSCGGDDFAHYGSHGPALMVFVGLQDAPGFTAAGLHTSRFLPPEESIRMTAHAMMLGYQAAAELLAS